MKASSEILELIEGDFRRVEWADFVQLPVREICRRPFVLKAHGLYFVGDGWGTDVGKIVARKHPGKVRHLIEWLEIVLPYWDSDLMDKPLAGIPLRKIGDGNASEILARIQALASAEAMA
ncbi:MAG: hypothetical protein WC683_05220 [bacterium]